MKRLPFIILAFLMVFMPIAGMAQSARPVAVMPFTGEEDEVNNQFRDAVAVEIGNLPGNFPPTSQYLPPTVTAEEIPPDEPPPPYLVNGWQYVVTGASFPDDGEHHLQVWLWDVDEPTLIYTDELVCEEIEDAAEFMPLLIEWIFSHVPPPEEEEEEEEDLPAPRIAAPPQIERQEEAPVGQRSTVPIFEDEDKWFYVGFRLGGSGRYYTGADSSLLGSGLHFDKVSRISPSFEGGVLGSVQLLPFFAIQAEVLFTMDTARFEAYEAMAYNVGTRTVEYSYMSLMIPLIAKLTLRPIPFQVAPFAGAYYVIPLGGLKKYDSFTGVTEESLEYIYSPLSVGLTVGLNVGMKMSQFIKGAPGMIFFDLRYAQDFFGEINYREFYNAKSKNGTEFVPAFSRGMISLSLGYQIGLVNRDIKATSTNSRTGTSRRY